MSKTLLATITAIVGLILGYLGSTATGTECPPCPVCPPTDTTIIVTPTDTIPNDSVHVL